MAAYEGPDWTFVGYVVTDGPKIICFAKCHIMDERDADGARKEKEVALSACRLAAADPAFAAKSPAVTDYRQYGKLDSTELMPDDAYRWNLAPVGVSPDLARLSSTRLFPFCRFRFARMLREHNRLRFSLEVRAEYHSNVVGLHNDEEGTSVFAPCNQIYPPDLA